MVAKKAKAKSETTVITVEPLHRARMTVRIVGMTPLFQNRMSNKVTQILLVGGKKKTKAERVGIKHDPLCEYRDSAEILSDGPTALGLRVTAVKAAMCDAAIRTAGVAKTEAQQLLFMPGDLTPLYGIPQLRMDVVRSADANRTPDIRIRAFLPTWGAEVAIQYIVPELSATSVVTLLCNAGIIMGVGDYRQQKGKGTFGSFRVLGEGEKDNEWDDLVKNHGRMRQLKALEKPEFANKDTADLMEFYLGELKRRAA